MRKCCLLALIAGALHAAVIRGTVVEQQTGKVLARALVVVQPVAGTSGPAVSVRTNAYGVFETPPVPGGAYLVTVSRRAFATMQYGQKQWKSAGVPIILEEAQTTSLSIRLPRLGSIAGTVLDENDVGLPEHDVAVYRNTRPPQLIGRVKSDERGMYRYFGLEPGKYLVRTIGKQYEEGGYLPTFHKEVTAVDQAYPVEVNLDQQAEDVNMRPFPGRLFTLIGQVQSFPQALATVTLVSDTGTETTTSDGSGNFQFNPAPPGPYEVFAQTPGDRRTPMTAAFVTLTLDRDRADIRLSLQRLPGVQFVFEDNKGQPIDSRTIQVTARRKDLSGEAKPEMLRPLANSAVQLMPGRWDLALAPMASYYVANFSGPRSEGPERGRPDGWNEITLPGGNPGVVTVRFTLSPNPGALNGKVTGPGQSPVAGAPVYLEAYDQAARKRLTDVRVARTDLRGQYHFYGLAAGNYRVLSTFEFQMPDVATMDAAAARAVNIEEGRDLVQNLDLYVIQ